MAYLALCQRVARRAAIAGASSGKPDDVVGQPERLQRICDYVAEAVREIETAHVDWTFMRPSIDFFVEARCGFVDPRDTHLDVLSLNENAVYGRTERWHQQIVPMPWPAFRERREVSRQPAAVNSLPSEFSVDPSGAIQLSPVSALPFVLRAECVVAPAVLTSSDDTPHIPASHHDVIFYRALALHYETDEAEFLMRTAEARFAEWMGRLEALYLPNNAWSRTHSPEQPLQVWVD